MGDGAGGAWPFIGRDPVVARILSGLRTGRGAVIVGDAGVGKTSLAREVCRRADERGQPVQRAVGSRSASGFPLGALAPLLPALVDPVEDQSALLRRAVAALLAPGERSVLFVDDAHLLDDDAATVVHQLALAGRPVVATVRRGEPCPDAVTALWKDNHAERVDVAPLSREQVEVLTASALGGPVDGVTTSTLWDRSRGNPLYLRELLHGALDAGHLVEDGGLWRLRRSRAVTPALVDLVTARVGRLSEQDRRVVDVLAVAGELPLELLDSIVGDRTAALERAALVEVRIDGRRTSVGLCHPVHEEVLGRLVPAVVRRSIQRDLAEAMAATGARRRDDILRLALWRLEGGGEADGDLMLAAARRAAGLHDDVLTERLATAAADAGAGLGASMLVGRAIARQGRVAEAEERFAATDLTAASDEERVSHAVLRTNNLFWALGDAEEALAVAATELAQVVDPAWRAQLAGNRAVYAFMSGHPRDAIESVDDVMAGAAGRVTVATAMALAPSLAITGRPDDGAAVAERGIDARLGLDDDSLTELPMLRMARGHSLNAAGRFSAADEELARAYEDAVAGHDGHAQAWVAMIRGQGAAHRGLPATADRWFAEGAAKFGETGQPGLERVCLAGRAQAAALRGDLAAERFAAAVRERDPHRLASLEPEVQRCLAWVDVLGGAAAQGRERAQGAATAAAGMGAVQQEALALHDLVRLGDRSVLERLGAVAAGQQGLLVPVLGRHAEAVLEGPPTRLEAVVDELASIELHLAAAEVAAAAADAHRRAGDGRGARRCAHRAAELATRSEGAHTPALDLAGAAGRLTERERQVAALVSRGQPNKVVAAELGLSVRTVETHLARVYRKLGVDREGLAAAVERESPT